MTPREALKRLLNENIKSNKIAQFYDTIETALNRLEELKKENHFLTKELKKQDKEIIAIEILKTYIFKDRLFYKFGSEISYVGLKTFAYEFYYGMPTDKAKIIKEVFEKWRTH